MSKTQRRTGRLGSAGRGARAALLTLVMAPGTSLAAEPQHCSETAQEQLQACLAELRDDFFTAQARCRNQREAEERNACYDEAQSALAEGGPHCRAQFDARRALCARIGEARIDPQFEPELFDDPRHPTRPNPYFPLKVGNRWVYAEGREVDTVEVLDEIKRIDEVPCIVVHDRLTLDGQPVEDTEDWYGARKDGSVAYCGELAREYETFEGDDPQKAELVSIEGSWKAERDGSLAGTIFLAQPGVGRTYRQEWSAGAAEDAAEVVSTRYRYGATPLLDARVPRRLVERLCAAGDCVVTRDFTPIEPDGFQFKYYARGIGLFLEVNPATGSTVVLRECNFDPRCTSLR